MAKQIGLQCMICNNNIKKMLRDVKKYTSQIMENTKNSLKGATLLEKGKRDDSK